MTLAIILALALGLGAFLLRGRWRSTIEVVAVAATLAAGLGGYALGAHPSVASRPARIAVPDRDHVSGFEAAQAYLLANTGDTAAWLTYADALERSGETLAAIRGLERGLADQPRDADLWIGLGEALALHGGDAVTPAARLAFDRGAMLAPGRPAPPYFLGAALIRAGDPAAALRQWATITPSPGAAWMPLLAANVAAARRMLAR